jgi:hypothetical protein
MPGLSAKPLVALLFQSALVLDATGDNQARLQVHTVSPVIELEGVSRWLTEFHSKQTLRITADTRRGSLTHLEKRLEGVKFENSGLRRSLLATDQV